MNVLTSVLLLILLINAVMVVCVRKLLSACIIFMVQSLVMVLIWILLQAPDLAVTEAAVGAGISSLLFFLALRRIRALGSGEESSENSPSGSRNKKGGAARA